MFSVDEVSKAVYLLVQMSWLYLDDPEREGYRCVDPDSVHACSDKRVCTRYQGECGMNCILDA